MRRTKQLSVPLMTNQLSSKPDERAFARVTCITLKWWRIDFPVISVRHVFSNQALLLLSGRRYDTGPPNASSAQNWPSPLIITWKNKQSGFGYSTGRLWSLFCVALPSAAGAWSTTPKCHITPSKEIDFFSRLPPFPRCCWSDQKKHNYIIHIADGHLPYMSVTAQRHFYPFASLI